MGDAVSIRGKRYAIDAEKLLKDTDVYFLAYKGRLSTDSLKSQLKEGKLNYSHFHALKDAGFNIEDYWIKDSPINTVQVDDKLLYSLLEDFKKYKKLANSIEGFMSVKLYKPLKGYMEFCDSINCSYTKLCNDEDYLLWFDELEKKQYKGIIDPPSPISKEIIEPADNKPKAYIKEKPNVPAELASIRSELSAIKNCGSILFSEWSDYGKDERSIISCFSVSPANSRTHEMSDYGLEVLAKHYKQLYHDLLKAIVVREITGNTYSIPNIAQRMLDIDSIYYLKKAHVKYVLEIKGTEKDE